jgi:hypothetical protein
MAAGDRHDMPAQQRSRGIIFEDGWSDSEVVAAESRFAFRLPPDLRTFLWSVLPSGRRFTDWAPGTNWHSGTGSTDRAGMWSSMSSLLP